MVVAYDNKTKKELHFSNENCLKKYNEKNNRNLKKSVKCKRLGIMAFQSGRTLITAGKSRKDLTDAFNFISGIYKKYNKEIRLKQSSLIVEPVIVKKQKKSMTINKSNIRLSDDLLKKLNIKKFGFISLAMITEYSNYVVTWSQLFCHFYSSSDVNPR